MKLWLLILVLIPVFSLGQSEFNQGRDSLNLIIQNERNADTTRTDAYIRLSEYCYMLSLDSTAIVCEAGVTFIQQALLKQDPTTQKKLIEQEAQLINNAGLFYYRKGELDMAISKWYESLVLKEEINDLKGQANVLNNIGNVQLDLAEIEKSKATFKQCLSIQNEINDSSGIARTYNVIGYIERTAGNDSLALNWYKKSLEIRILLDNKSGIAASRNNIGFIHKKNGNYSLAIEQYESSLALYDAIHYEQGKIPILSNLANCYYEIGLLSKAEKYAAQGYELAYDLESLDDLKYIYEIQYKISESKKEFKKAFNAYRLFIDTRDSLDSKKNYKALINQEAEYEFQKKEAVQQLEREREEALSQLKHENEMQLADERSFRLKTILAIISISLLIVLSLLYLIIKQLRLTKKQQAIITLQNQQIEMKALRSQMNPHFLFNSLNSIKHYIIKNNPENAASYLTKFATLIRLVLEHSNRDLIRLEEELNCLSHYMELERLRFDGKFEFSIQTETATDFIQVPPLILQPFVENAIWHGILNKKEGGGEIKLTVREEQGDVIIEIEDNGIGRKKAAQHAAEQHASKISMGLSLTHDRLASLNKQTGLQSTIKFIDLYDHEEKGIGTKVIITLPQHD